MSNRSRRCFTPEPGDHPSPRSRFALTVVAGLAALTLAVTAAEAQRMPVSPDLQAAILSKVFRFDRTLQDAGLEAHVLVTYSGTVPEVVEELVEAFETASISVEAVEVSRLGDKLSAAAIVYLVPGVDLGAVRDLVAGRGVLLVTGVPSWVRDGSAAVGIDSRGAKPTILVHLPQVQASRHQLSAELLGLAEVVQ